jgi:hypothetical protein
VRDLTISEGNCIPVRDDITLSGESIKDGYGGGVYTVNCGRNLNFENLSISGNSARNGGGMYNHKSSPTLSGLTIRGNAALSISGSNDDGYGGGIFNGYPKGSIPAGGICYESSPLITDETLISDNLCVNGGGIANRYASPVLNGVTVSDNTASFGGGIHNEASVLTAVNTEISGNQTTQSNGGGIYNTGYILLANVRIRGNLSFGRGGGIYISGGLTSYDAMLFNTEISGNSANTGGGGGIYADNGAKITISNATISGNSASPGAGIYYDNLILDDMTIYDSILWNGASGVYPGVDPAVYKNTLAEHKGGIVTSTPSSLVSYTGLATALFEGPVSSAPALGDYRLKGGSFAINKGVNADYPLDEFDDVNLSSPVYSELEDFLSDLAAILTIPLSGEIQDVLLDSLTADLAGNDRFNGAIDLGAYENQ